MPTPIKLFCKVTIFRFRTQVRYSEYPEYRQRTRISFIYVRSCLIMRQQNQSEGCKYFQPKIIQFHPKHAGKLGMNVRFGKRVLMLGNIKKLQFKIIQKRSIQQIRNNIRAMAGKKWCQYCRINLPYDKKAIEEHEATRRHIHNKQKHIKFERIKIQRTEKAKRQELKANSFTSTANIPKAKKGSQLEKQVQQFRNDVIMTGKMAIHQLIAQRTKGLYGAPIQYPQKQDLVLAENYQSQDSNQDGSQPKEDDKFEMWKIDICQQTGKACFINRISQAKLYEPPKGYIMSEQQKEQWEETKKICDEIPDQNMEQAGEAGQWEQVIQEDYFQQNKASDEEQCAPQLRPAELTQNQSIQTKIQPKLEIKSEIQVQKPKTWVQQLNQRIQNNQMTESQVIGTVLTNTLQECRTVKQKNEALKKLVKNDFEIRVTLAKNDEQLLKLQEKGQTKKSIGIKPRKKVKTCQIVEDKDIV